jgi:hypothetical protein
MPLFVKILPEDGPYRPKHVVMIHTVAIDGSLPYLSDDMMAVYRTYMQHIYAMAVLATSSKAYRSLLGYRTSVTSGGRTYLTTSRIHKL